jgi:hypothetical protein
VIEDELETQEKTMNKYMPGFAVLAVFLLPTPVFAECPNIPAALVGIVEESDGGKTITWPLSDTFKGGILRPGMLNGEPHVTEEGDNMLINFSILPSGVDCQ